MKKGCPFVGKDKEPTSADCGMCHAINNMPNYFCCGLECGEHEFCHKCDRHRRQIKFITKKEVH